MKLKVSVHCLFPQNIVVQIYLLPTQITLHSHLIIDFLKAPTHITYLSIFKKWKDPLNSKVDPCIDIPNHDSLFMRQAKLQQSRGMLLSPKKYEWSSMILGLNYLAIKWFYLVGNSSTTCKYHGSWPFDKPTPHDWWHEKRKKEKRVLEVKA